MTDLINLQTGMAENLPPGDAENAFLTGTHGVDPDQPVNIVHPTTGVTYEVKPEDAAQYLQQGYTIERPHQEALREYRADVQANPVKSGIETMADQAVNQFALGVPHLAEDLTSKPDDTGNITESEKNTILASEHPAANIFGGAVGVGGSVFYGGPAMKGIQLAGDAAVNATTGALEAFGPKAATSLAGKIITKTAGASARGAASMVPQAITEAALGDHETVAEGLMAGISDLGAGAVTGPFVEALASPVAHVINLAGQRMTPELLDEAAAKYQLKDANFKTPELGATYNIENKANKLWPADATAAPEDLSYGEAYKNATDFFANYGVKNGDSPQVITEKLQAGLEANEKKLNTIRSTADEALAADGKTGAFGGQELNSVLDNLRDIHNTSSGEQFGDLTAIENAKDLVNDKLIEKLPLDAKFQALAPVVQGDPQLANTLLDIAGRESPIAQRSAIRDLMNANPDVDAALTKAAQNSTLTFEDMQSLKSEIKALAYGKNGQAGTDGGADVYSRLFSGPANLFDTKLDAVATKYGGSTLDGSVARDARKENYKLNQYVLNDPTKKGPLATATKRLDANSNISLGDEVAAGVGASIGATRKHGLLGAMALGAANYVKRNYGNRLISSTLSGTARILDHVQSKSLGAIDSAISGSGGRLKSTSANILARVFAGDKNPPKDNTGRLAAFNARLGNTTSNPVIQSEVTGAVTSPFTQDAPNIQQALAAKIANATNYLQNEIPRTKSAINPMDPHQYVPTDREMSQYQRKVHTVLDPLSAIDELKHGTITKEHVQALDAVYPKLTNALRQQVMHKLGNTTVPLKQRAALSLFMGPDSGFQKDGTHIALLQQGFAPSQPPKPRANSKITAASRLGTETDRVINDQ